MRSPHLLLAMTVPLWAQFNELATTDDGRQLYFSSTLVLAGAAPGRAESRIYRVGADGAQLVAERGTLAAQFVGGSGDGAVLPQVSGDGNTIGFTLRNVCPPGDPCTQPIPAQGELRGSRAMDLGAGTLQMSRNGRWAVLATAPNPFTTGSSTLVNLDTGERTAIPQPATSSFAVASDGAVLANQNGALGLWRQGEFRALRMTGAFRPLALSDNGGVFLYLQMGQPGEVRLAARHLASAQDTVLSAPGQAPWLMGLSNDGRWVLYRALTPWFNGPPFLADTLTGESTPLPLESGETVSAGTLSGSGNVVYLATSAGRVVRVDLPGGAQTTVVPPTPYVASHNQFSPGSLARLAGALPGAIDELRGRLLLDDRPLPVLWVNPDEVAVQVPWEQRTGEFPFRVDVPATSPFRQNELAMVVPMAPRFEQDPAGILGIKLIKGDFSGMVTAPPAAGEVVHSYMTGLGPVRGQVQTGAPAPVGSALPIVGDLHCRFLPQASEAETLFAGLAPGMTGIYQVSFRMPADAGSAPLNGMECRYGGPGISGSFGFVRLGGGG